jgi:nitroreductase
MEFSDVIKHRRSVRSYRPDPPPRELIDRLIDIARRAPTAGFSQGIDFLVLDDASALHRFWELTSQDGAPSDPDDGGSRPPVIVLVFSDPVRYLARYSEGDKAEYGLQEAENWPSRFWDVDAGMASMLLLLAAVDADLGAWFFGIAEGASQLRAELGVPEDRNLVGVIGLGYRFDREVAIGSGVTRKRRPLDDQLHRNGW